jgi:hypothetical protein
MDEAMKKSRIPQTDSIQELAEFWDSHDSTDFEDELIEMTEPVFERETSVQVTLPSSDAQAIEQIARVEGVTREELIRQWVRQQLGRRNGQPASRGPKPRPTGRRSKK